MQNVKNVRTRIFNVKVMFTLGVLVHVTKLSHAKKQTCLTNL